MNYPPQDQSGADYTIFLPETFSTIDIDSLVGTHLAVGSGFSDGRRVEDTVKEIVQNPSIISTHPNFVLTIFKATKIGDKNGMPHYWSANNRRLNAMKQAKGILGDLPPVQVKWATESDIRDATQPQKWGNGSLASHGIGYHNTSTQTQRLSAAIGDTSKRQNQVETNTKQIEKIQKGKEKSSSRSNVSTTRPKTKNRFPLDREEQEKLGKNQPTSEDYEKMFGL